MKHSQTLLEDIEIDEFRGYKSVLRTFKSTPLYPSMRLIDNNNKVIALVEILDGIAYSKYKESVVERYKGDSELTKAMADYICDRFQIIRRTTPQILK